MVIYELITHHAPFADRSALQVRDLPISPPSMAFSDRGIVCMMSALQAAAAAGLENKRPSLPPGTPPLMCKLLMSAWSTKREDRPRAADAHATLLAIRAALTPEQIAWLDMPDGHPSSQPPVTRTSGEKTAPSVLSAILSLVPVHGPYKTQLWDAFSCCLPQPQKNTSVYRTSLTRTDSHADAAASFNI